MRVERLSKDNFNARNNKLVDLSPSKYSAIVLTGNKRYTSLSPGADYGHWRSINTANPLNSRKRNNIFFAKKRTENKEEDSNLENSRKNVSTHNRRSVTIDSAPIYYELENPTMYKSKPRLQVRLIVYSKFEKFKLFLDL